MRRRFNEGKYWEKLTRGELISVVLEERIPKDLRPNEPPGTLSQMISYRNPQDDEIARVHQYLRPNKQIGASGKPDPKRLFENGILYRLVKSPKA